MIDNDASKKLAMLQSIALMAAAFCIIINISLKNIITSSVIRNCVLADYIYNNVYKCNNTLVIVYWVSSVVFIAMILLSIIIQYMQNK